MMIGIGIPSNVSLELKSSSTRSWERRERKIHKKKNKDPPLAMKFCSLSPFSQKMERWIDVFFKTVGTDGDRTRSFRLDRAVLWPIELQSQGNERIYPKIGFFFIPLYQVFLKGKGLYYLMGNWRIFGPSWIWTSVDILPTNLQSVPINRSGIDPGRILFRLIGNSWLTYFPSTLPPGEVESPLPPWKRDVLNR